MADFTGTLRLEIETARSDVFVWGLSTWTGYRFAGPADSPEAGTEWTDILGETHEIKVRRGGQVKGLGVEIQAGDLSATVLDPAIDPSSSPYIKPGTPIRLMHNDDPVFTGELRNIKVTYKNGQPRVFLSAVDKVKDLNNLMRYGVAFGTDFPSRVQELLGKQGIAHETHGTTSTTLEFNDYQSTLFNHIGIAANSEQGRWFVDKGNVIQAYTKTADLPAVVYTFTDKASTGPTEIEYVDIGVSYDSADLVNEIMVKNLTRVWNEENMVWDSVETEYGPYRNGTSIATYGNYQEDVQTNMVAAQIADFVDELLDRAGSPQLRVSNVRANFSEDTATAADFEIYDQVSVEYENEYVRIDDTYTVLAIEHEISASNTNHKWMTTLELNKLGGS